MLMLMAVMKALTITRMMPTITTPMPTLMLMLMTILLTILMATTIHLFLKTCDLNALGDPTSDCLEMSGPTSLSN